MDIHVIRMKTNNSNIKKLKLPVLVGPLSAIQPLIHPLTFNIPWSLGYSRKLDFGSPWGNYFTIGFVCSQHNYSNQEYQTCTDTALSGYLNSHLGRVEPRRFNSCALRNSRYASVEFEPWISRSAVKCATTEPTRPDRERVYLSQYIS